MSRTTKIVAWLLAAVVAFFVIAAVALFVFFDPNDFREDIADAVAESTGRELVIEGDVSISLFPWLAVEVGKSELGNAPGFGDEPFAEFESAKMGVQVLPLLLRREVAVGTIAVESLAVNFEENRQGANNWDDLSSVGTAEADADATGGEAIEGTIDVAGIRFSNATIRYQDAAGAYSLTGAELSIGAITGRGDDLNVDGMSLQGLLEGVVSTPSELVIETAGIAVQTSEEVVTMQPVEMAVLGLDISANVEPFSYAGDVEPVAAIQVDAFSPRSLMQLFDVEEVETADPSALSSVVMDATAAVKATAIELSDVNIKLDDTTFKGTLAVPLIESGAYRMDLKADRIDLGRYMEPATDAPEAEDADTVPVEIPSELIRPLKARGNLTLDAATFGEIEFTNVKLGLNIGGGRLRLHPVSAGLFGGSYNGDVRIDATGAAPTLSVDEKIEGVNLANLAAAMFEQENVTGTIGGVFKLSGRGEDMAAIQRSLSGSMAIELLDGTYEGTDIWYELRRARAKLKNEEPPEPELPARTKFSSVTATGVVRDGVMQNDDFFAELPFMQLRGRGSVDLAAATIDYGLTARVLERPESLSGVTQEELDDFTEAEIPLKITGSLESPSVLPDFEKLIRDKVEEEIEDQIKDKLKDIFGR